MTRKIDGNARLKNPIFRSPLFHGHGLIEYQSSERKIYEMILLGFIALFINSK